MKTTRILPAGAFLVLVAVAPAARADEDDAARRVDASIAGWRDVPTLPADLERALVGIGGDAVPRLTRLLDEVDPDDELMPVGPVARALVELHHEKSIPCLARLAVSARSSDRAIAIATLAEIPTAESLAIIVAAVDREFSDEARVAAGAIPTVVARRPELLRDSLYKSLSETPNHDVAAGVLGRLGTPTAHELLLRLLDHSKPELQSAAMDGLWDAATADDVDALRKFLRPSRPPGLRKKVSLLLGHLHAADAVPELIDLLNEEDPSLVATALWSLQTITGQCLEADPDLWTRWWDGGGSEQILARASEGEPEASNAPPTEAAPPSELPSRAGLSPDGFLFQPSFVGALAAIALLGTAFLLIKKKGTRAQ